MAILSLSRPLRVARWFALLVFLAAALFFLNDAIFSAWVAGGPPTEHKIGWERSSQSSLLFSLASLFSGTAAFLALGRYPHVGRVFWVLSAMAASLAAFPFVAREILIDQCLDSGGRWSKAFIECEH
jgi:hypothetical protein